MWGKNERKKKRKNNNKAWACFAGCSNRKEKGTARNTWTIWQSINTSGGYKFITFFLLLFFSFYIYISSYISLKSIILCIYIYVYTCARVPHHSFLTAFASSINKTYISNRKICTALTKQEKETWINIKKISFMPGRNHKSIIIV